MVCLTTVCAYDHMSLSDIDAHPGMGCPLWLPWPRMACCILSCAYCLAFCDDCDLYQVTLDFSLSEQVYAKAKVKDVTSVGLWLGADVMLDYALEDAKQLLVSYPSGSPEGDVIRYTSSKHPKDPHTFCIDSL